MKVVLKAIPFRSNEIRYFFLENILPILNYGIAFEYSKNTISVYEKKGARCKVFNDPTAEIVVELNHETILLAKNLSTDPLLLKKEAGDFYDEALAIREIEKLKPKFSREYYSCSYSFGGVRN